MTQIDPGKPEPGAHSRRTWLMIAAVILLTALAISLVPEDKPALVELPKLPDAAEPQAQAPLKADTAGQAAATSATEQSPAGAQHPVAAPDTPVPGQAARAFIEQLHAQGKEDPEAAVAEANKHWQAKHLEDAYLLYFYAARLGNSEAALAIATQADPAYHSSDRSALAQPDIPLALKWYGQAAAAGSQAAKVRLQALHRRVEQAAAQGDQDAQRLVLQWQ